MTQVSGGRNDPRNILGDVYVGRDPQKRKSAPNSVDYKHVVDRLTKKPLVFVERQIALENKSYELQTKQIQMERSRRLYDGNSIANLSLPPKPPSLVP